MSTPAFGAVAPQVIDHLQRVHDLPPFDGRDGYSTYAPPGLRRLRHITGVANPRKPALPVPGAPVEPPVTERLLAGLAGYGIPVAFSLGGDGSSVSVHLGTWSSAAGENAQPPVLDARQGIVAALLGGLYGAVRMAPADAAAAGWPVGGIALGVPRSVAVDPTTGAGAVDRLIRSMVGQRWGVLVLAEPISSRALARVRHRVTEEMRTAHAAEHHEGRPNPVVRSYVELLTSLLDDLTVGQAVGAWRSAVYLLGDAVSYPCLAAAWSAVYAGGAAVADPVRVHDVADAAAAAQRWLLPDGAGPKGPTGFAHPYGAQSLLTSAQLAELVQLPRLEAAGFAVELAPAFDVVPPAAATDGVVVGSVLDRGRLTGGSYRIPPDRLTRHALVAGVTGSGKTNTLFHLLDEVHRRQVPFLVLEPAKTEYRALLDHPAIGPELRVFTVGDERVSPIRLNPFQPAEGTTVAEHLDLLRAAFGASFGMWTPLPQVLERCLYEVYLDRGWELRTNANHRVPAGQRVPAEAFPTLTELVAKVREVVPALGYDDRVTADLGAALTTRLDSLRRGGKGAMLDVTRSTPLEELFAGPCVLELEGLGDDGDKAFFMALVLILMAEHRRGRGLNDGLAHVLVIEEAHRVLSAAPSRRSEEQADPRGQAVDTFTHLLAEVRAYGQGLVIVDQVPNRLAPEVLKNTGLKVAHRVVAADDRAALAATMVMEQEQERALTILGPGEAAVFGEGADAAVLVRVPLVKAPSTLSDPEVRDRAERWRAASPVEACDLGCRSAAGCELARAAVDDELVQRVIGRITLSAVVHNGALDRLWADLVAVVAPRRTTQLDLASALASVSRHGALWYAERRSAQAGWDYAMTDRLRRALTDVLLHKVSTGDEVAGDPVALSTLRAMIGPLHAYDVAPYPDCERICAAADGCPYRWGVADLVRSGRYSAAWQVADEEDARRPQPARAATWELCQDGAYDLVEFPEPEWDPSVAEPVADAARRVALCFGQQMLHTDRRKLPRTARRVMSRLFEEAGL